MDRKKAKTSESTHKKYNESEVIKKFLVSSKGVSFLVDHINRRRLYESTHVDTDIIMKDVDNLIDYYAAWIHSFPVRRSTNITRYEFLEYLESFCERADVCGLFDFIFI
ncbi:hypothetical protein M896_090410 [Ordospora colligata OC4]|uniref:Uncharacterized protein n=1 Tax=Ordospora colligata OC4 TaxID=1354746 RepID=A0A0B2UJ83_9MICR|nr:uncharacterized protein M896_090410 [Ordospora colligata OC4]KHN69117.1 hypothetical protein M896_090410 [Ordospora colligata OC4]